LKTKNKTKRATGYFEVGSGFHSFVDRPPWEETAEMLIPLHQQKEKEKEKTMRKLKGGKKRSWRDLN
jgi:hypothetical protein